MDRFGLLHPSDRPPPGPGTRPSQSRNPVPIPAATSLRADPRLHGTPAKSLEPVSSATAQLQSQTIQSP
jgi:hypothetical protein